MSTVQSTPFGAGVCEQCGSVFPLKYRNSVSRTCSRICYDLFRTAPVIDRFFQFVGRKQPSGCIPWTGATANFGYGAFNVGGKVHQAHRLSYQFFVGEPGELCVLHRCDNPPCVNPDHLFVGTHDDNMADKFDKGRNCYGDANGSRRHPESRHRGETSPVAVLSDDDARRIHEQSHRFGRTQVSLAEEYGVSQSLVSLVVRAEGRYVWLNP